MTCKDCIHFNVCYYHDFDGCDYYKDKSKFIELPCKVGDMLYIPWVYDENISGVAFNKIECIKIYTADNIPILFLEDFESDMQMPTHYTKNDIGKTVFLTKEEAEKKLKERENNA